MARKRQGPEARRLAQIDQDKGQAESDQAAHGRHGQRQTGRLSEKHHIVEREKARDLFDDPFH
jgi:hypothetical protein